MPVLIVLYCQPDTRYRSLWYSIVTKRRDLSMWYSVVNQRHGACPCGTLKKNLTVLVLLYYHPDTRYQSLWYSTVTHRHGTLLYCHTKTRHGICPCAVLLSNRSTRMMSIFHGASPCGSLLSLIDTVLYSTVTQRHDTVFVPAVFYCLTDQPG